MIVFERIIGMKNRVIVKKDNPINDHMTSIADCVNPEVKIVASMMTIIFGISSFFMIALILLCLLCFFLGCWWQGC